MHEISTLCCPSLRAEKKPSKIAALRNACTANLRACLLFSSNSISVDFDARHNRNIDLCEAKKTDNL